MQVDWRRDWKLVGHMLLAAFLVVLVTGAFLTAFAFLIRTLVLLVFLRPLSVIPRALLSGQTAALPAWLTLGVPVGGTLFVFGGLLAVDRWRRGLDTRRFNAMTVAPPKNLEQQVALIAMSADVPPPSVRLVETSIPTAFTTGVGVRRATITVTSGLLTRLGEDEVQAVLAHEISHIKNRDVTVMTVAMMPVVIAAGILTLVTIDEPEYDGRIPLGPNSRAGHQFEGVLGSVFGALAGGFWLLLRAATALFSRHRELAADRGAVALTGEPATLATALEKLGSTDRPQTDLRTAGVEAFSIVPLVRPDEPWAAGWQTPLLWLPADTREAISKHLALHPPTDQRIHRLRELVAKLENPAS